MSIRVYNCERCNVEFEPKRLEQRFHSAECYNESLRERDSSRVCLRDNCGKIITDRDQAKVYCSRSCSAKVNNSRRVKKLRTCKSCGEEFWPGDSNKVYCGSNGCKKKSKISLWLAGDWDGTVSAGLARCVRDYLLEQADYKCSECSWSGTNPVSGRTTLTVDHIDGNSTNNKRSNLKVLCPNCHSLTPTYGALNKGKGRSSRYK